MNTYLSMGIKVFRTDELGSIVAASDGERITCNCAPSETWQQGEPTGSP
jgi:competence protein ComEC